jgi:hypothetical protein
VIIEIKLLVIFSLNVKGVIIFVKKLGYIANSNGETDDD